jgi:queuine tRNA-ribosyltransferase subunit QTRTD1
LECVERGVDVFDGTYPFKLAEFGFASVFPLDSNGQAKSPLKINLRDLAFARDATPIMTNCKCLACRSHTRAYIHHLLNAHEMLAEVLLTM